MRSTEEDPVPPRAIADESLPPSKLVPRLEACEVLGVCDRKFDLMVRSGELGPVVRLGTRVFVEASVLHDFIESHRTCYLVTQPRV